jgi:predicted Rossmann fold flavoprotein
MGSLMSQEQSHFNVIVIGGGASGLMAAGVAASRGRSVLVLEKNAAQGRKLDMTGGGRCNITNISSQTTREFLARYGDEQVYFYSPFSQFSVKDTIAFFEKLGLSFKEEAGGRLFPATEKASDVTRTLVDYMNEGGVTVKTNTTVLSLSAEQNRITEVKTTNGTFTADSIVLATGGVSHPETGSTGDGFGWLRDLGHTIKTPDATLVPLKVSDSWIAELAGVTLDTMKITFLADGTKAFSKNGRLLFTHFGISGPLVINSAKEVGELIKKGKAVTATIDLFPGKEFPELDRHIIEMIDANKNKLFKNILDDIIPPAMSVVMMPMLALSDPEIRAHSLTQEERRRLVHLLKAFPLHIEGLMGLDRAIVSDGGIMLDEIDTREMRSLKIENLFVTGDLLNVNRPSGGYSLQLCWTTGYVAGMHA